MIIALRWQIYFRYLNVKVACCSVVVCTLSVLIMCYIVLVALLSRVSTWQFNYCLGVACIFGAGRNPFARVFHLMIMSGGRGVA